MAVAEDEVAGVRDGVRKISWAQLSMLISCAIMEGFERAHWKHKTGQLVGPFMIFQLTLPKDN